MKEKQELEFKLRNELLEKALERLIQKRMIRNFEFASSSLTRDFKPIGQNVYRLYIDEPSSENILVISTKDNLYCPRNIQEIQVKLFSEIQKSIKNYKVVVGHAYTKKYRRKYYTAYLVTLED